MTVQATPSTETLLCKVCQQSGHESGIECPSCCGMCGGAKDTSGSCSNKCGFKDFWDAGTPISNGVPLAWRDNTYATIFVNWPQVMYQKRIG